MSLNQYKLISRLVVHLSIFSLGSKGPVLGKRGGVDR